MKYDKDPDEWDFRVPFTTEEAERLAVFLEANSEMMDRPMAELLGPVRERLQQAAARQRVLDWEE